MTEDAQRLVILPVLMLLSLAVGRLLAGRSSFLREHHPLEQLLVYSLFGVVTVSWAGTLLAALGIFRWWALLIALLAPFVVQVARRSHNDAPAAPALPRPARTSWLEVVALVALALLLGWLIGRPAESYFISDDSGVYTLAGTFLAREGQLDVPDAGVWTIDRDFERAFSSFEVTGSVTRYYGPFFQWFTPGKPVEIGFLPLPKVWVALMVWLFGADAATWGTPFVGLLAVLVLYGIVRRVWRWPTGLAAALFLGLSFPQIWFSRYPISEAYAQLLVLGGMYLIILARQNAHDPAVAGRLAGWSGACLAAMMITRLEGAFIVAGLVAVALMQGGRDPLARGGYARKWLASLGLFSLVGLLISAGVSRHYLLDQSLRILTPAVTRAALAAALILILGSGLLRQRGRLSRQAIAVAIRKVARWLPVAVALLWLAMAALVAVALVRQNLNGTVAGWLVQYWTAPGMFFSIGGALWLLWQQHRQADQPEMLALLGVAALFLVGYSINPLVGRQQPWALRRLVPVVLPVLAVGAAVLAVEGPRALAGALARRTDKRSPRILGGVVAAAVVVLLGFGLARNSYPILLHRELQGLRGQLQRIADGLPQDAVLLFDNGDTARVTMQFFALLCGHPSVAIRDDFAGDGQAAVDRLLEAAEAQNRPAFLVVTDGDLKWWPSRRHLSFERAEAVHTTLLRQTPGERPGADDIVSRTFWFDIYRVLPGDDVANAFAEGQLEVHAGPGSYPYFRDGFYGWEVGVGEQVVRWTDGDGLLSLPWPSSDLSAPASFCLTLRVSGGRFAGVEPAHLTVHAEDRQVFATTLAADFAPATLDVPVTELVNRDASDLAISLESNTWIAPDSGPDQRPLGIMIYGLSLAPLAQCQAPQ